MAITPVVAQLYGARNFRDIGVNARQGLWLSQLLAIPVFFSFAISDSLWNLLEVTPEDQSRVSLAGDHNIGVSFRFAPTWPCDSLTRACL
ncbi:MAG: MATE family efflux transporter [Balneolaceae bacterium]|nr:MATE family efflux transporter [Balneolaceae bacterium]